MKPIILGFIAISIAASAAPKNPADYIECNRLLHASYWLSGPRTISGLADGQFGFPGNQGAKLGFFLLTGDKMEFCPLPNKPFKKGVAGANPGDEEMTWYKMTIAQKFYYADQGIANPTEILVRNAVEVSDKDKRGYVKVTCVNGKEKNWSESFAKDIAKRLDAVKERMLKPDVKAPPNDGGMYAELDKVIAACSKVLEARENANALKATFRPDNAAAQGDANR